MLRCLIVETLYTDKLEVIRNCSEKILEPSVSDNPERLYYEGGNKMKKSNWHLFIVFSIFMLILVACTNDSTEEEEVVEKDVVTDADPERLVKDISILTRPQASAQGEYETAVMIRDGLKEIGVKAELNVMPWAQLSDTVWYERDSWDITGWQMTARPERLDPDEFTYNLFHSQGIEDGYNFMGYNNPEYDAIAEAQRVEMDKEERAELIKQAQQIISDDAVYHFTVHPKINVVYNTDVFKEGSVKDMAGLGARNFWTYINAEPAGEQKDIILNSADNVSSINPFYISGSADSWVTELVWDRLMRVNVNGLPEPWVAETVQWEDDTTLNITLRQDMKWHDGEPVTAEDVKFSFEAPMSGEAPMYEPFVEIIEKVEIVSDYELVFKLKRPWAAFETASLAKLNIVPKHIWEPILNEYKKKPENLESYQEETPIGSGPFKFSNWKFQAEVVLDANKEHFSAPKMDRWILRIISNMEAALGMIQNGEINFLASYSGDANLLNQTVEESNNLKMISSIDLGFRFFAVNQRVEPFNDLAFRKALQAIIDKEAIAEIIWKGYAVPADSVIAPTLKFWKNTELSTPTGGVNEAIRTLKEAGYQWDEEGSLLLPK